MPPEPAPLVAPPVLAPALTVTDAALEAMQDAVLGLLGAIDAEDPADAAAALAEAADAAGLPGVAAASRRLTAGDRWAWLDLALRLRGVETASGRNAGAFALSAALEIPFADLLLEQAGALKTTPEDPAVWLHTARLLAGMEIEAGAELADLVATRLLRGEEVPDTDALSDLCALIGISASSGMEVPHEEIAALRDSWFGVPAAAAPPVLLPIDRAHPWPAETLLRMAGEAAAGRALALVLLDLESDPAAVDAVTDRLHAERCLYNRSRLDLGGGMFEHAVALSGDLDAFALGLAEADPSRACLRSVRATDATATPGREVGAPPPASPPVVTSSRPGIAAAGSVARARVPCRRPAPRRHHGPGAERLHRRFHGRDRRASAGSHRAVAGAWAG